jgi:hypothetical protein
MHLSIYRSIYLSIYLSIIVIIYLAGYYLFNIYWLLFVTGTFFKFFALIMVSKDCRYFISTSFNYMGSITINIADYHTEY